MLHLSPLQAVKIARNSKSRFLKNRIESSIEISESSITTSYYHYRYKGLALIQHHKPHTCRRTGAVRHRQGQYSA